MNHMTKSIISTNRKRKPSNKVRVRKKIRKKEEKKERETSPTRSSKQLALETPLEPYEQVLLL